MKNKLHNHIKNHLDKGRTIDLIKKELKILGYKEKHIEKLIRSYLVKHHLVKPLLISIIPLIVLLSLLFIDPTTIGYVSKEETYNYTDQINLALNQDDACLLYTSPSPRDRS